MLKVVCVFVLGITLALHVIFDLFHLEMPVVTGSWYLDAAKEYELINRLQDASLKAFRALGLEDYGLFDFRVDKNGIPWFLENNAVCSFSPYSLLNRLAKHAGLTDEEVFETMLKSALLREEKPLPAHLQN